ncbi:MULTISPECIES: hypothetical protein [unclassified Diaminobutyricimonas]|uniref:hypothetical protein n=1 Tax=unclassified Diaminobutyricimonas TaxID=2643261 RepID=UPI0012F4D7E7|nr:MULTISPECIES: hypothetical protein [unclassified Diaminobutyricimonas]
MNARLIAVPMAALSLLALSGCALAGGSGLSADEARDAFKLILDETQTAVGGEWEIRDDPTARGCTLPLWVDGERFPALRISPQPETDGATASDTSSDIASDPASDAVETVRAVWKDLGLSVESATVGKATELQATGEHGEALIFRVSDNVMTLQGESECRPD